MVCLYSVLCYTTLWDTTVESVFSANKRLFVPTLLAKTLPGQLNEVYCMLIAHNLIRLVHACYEMDDLVEVTNYRVFDLIEPSRYGSRGVSDQNTSDSHHVR